MKSNAFRTRFFARPHRLTRAVCLTIAATIGLTACGPKIPNEGIHDPYEQSNRAVFKSSVALDKKVLRPLAMTTVAVLPGPAEQGILNFADNLDLPGSVVNDILQGKVEYTVENTVRFVINSTIGIGGLFDPARALGVNGKQTDFGETLHVWGMNEGNYMVLPVFGPSTERDALGKVVDMGLNPLKMIIPSPKYLSFGAKLASRITERGRYSETVDSILYGSADGYAQARLLYLQHRRYNLGEAPPEDSFEDPYAQ